MNKTSPRLVGRIIALLLLLLLLTAVFAQGLVSNRLVVMGDAAATANNLLANKSLYQLSFTAFLIEMACQFALTALWYVLLRPVNRTIAVSSTFLDLAAGVFKTFARVFYILPLWVLGGSTGVSVLRGFTTEQLQSIALLLLQINNRGAAISSAFFGLSILLRGYLIFRSTFMPRWLGIMTMISALGWLTYFYPPLYSLAFVFAAIFSLVSSVATIIWLLAIGVREEKWKELAAD